MKGGRILESKYIYRKHLRKPTKFFLTIVLMFIIPYFMIASVVTLTATYEDKIVMGIIFLIIGVFVAVLLSIELLIIYFVLYRRFKKIYVVLNEEGIIYNNAGGEVRIPYENIKALKFPSIRYTGGWIKILHGNENIRLTVVLENIGDMVKSLKNKLDDKNLSSIYNDKAMYKFFKTAKYSDQSWERIYENVKLYFITTLINLGVAAIFSGFIAEVPDKIYAFIGALVGPLLVFFITEIIFGRKLAKGASKENFSVPNRDKQFEYKIYKWAFGICFIIFFMILVMAAI